MTPRNLNPNPPGNKRQFTIPSGSLAFVEFIGGSFYSFAEGRLRARMLLPYISAHLLNIIPIERPETNVFSMDRWGRLYYDPALLRKTTVNVFSMMLIQQDLFMLLNHYRRAKSVIGENASEKARTCWNLASTLVVNQILDDTKGCERPEGQPCIDDFGLAPNMSVEQYFNQLMGTQEQLPQIEQGSASNGQKNPWEEEEPDFPKDAGIHPFLHEMLCRHVAQDVIKAEAKSRGSVAGYMELFAKNILNPAVNPADEIKSNVRYAMTHQHGFGDYTFRKQSRRSMPGNKIRLPASIQPIPKIAILVDTSGSMDQNDLGLALGAVGETLKSCPRDSVEVWSGDAALQGCQKAFHAEQIQLRGGGGTNMGTLVEELAEKTPPPQVIICITDGYTPWPAKQIKPMLLICLTCARGRQYSTPDWAKTVEIRPKGAP